MKIASKTYLLIGILVSAAIFNLFLLYQDQNIDKNQSYSILKVGDIKVNAEAISSIAVEIASGNEKDITKLEKEFEKIQYNINTLESGGQINNVPVEKVPAEALPQLINVKDSWEKYKQTIQVVQKSSVFDPEATSALNYLLQKNGELNILIERLQDELGSLDRDYNRHKQIAKELEKDAIDMGQQTLLMSIGEDENAQEELQVNKLKFETGIRKLLQISTDDLDVDSIGEHHEDLIPIPRENSAALKEIDALWESMKIRIDVLKERSLLSEEYGNAKKEMNNQKTILYSSIDSLLQSWENEIRNQDNEKQVIIGILLIVNIIVFIIVFFVIRQSLLPLDLITSALSKIKEGMYGEKIKYDASDEVGELVQTFNIMSDTIREKEEEARRTDIAKDEFLAMITHELKTPLVPIQGYSDILLGEHLGKLTDKQRERINIIKSSSETLLSIISDLLDAQKLELGQLRMKKINENIKKTITKTVERMSPNAVQNNIEIVTKLLDIEINHDPDRISQVVSNMIKNSINSVQGKQGKIEIIMEDMQDEIKISVKDNGVGIPISKQADLFKKFYQVDATLTRERGGSGLGLAICKGIVENHGGRISVESAEGQGATFSFTLPKNTDGKRTPIGIT